MAAHWKLRELQGCVVRPHPCPDPLTDRPFVPHYRITSNICFALGALVRQAGCKRSCTALAPTIQSRLLLALCKTWVPTRLTNSELFSVSAGTPLAEPKTKPKPEQAPKVDVIT